MSDIFINPTYFLYFTEQPKSVIFEISEEELIERENKKFLKDSWGDVA